MAFKDAAHTRDLVTVGLSSDSSGSCKREAPGTCTDQPDRSKWCIHCKAKNPVN